MPPNGSCTIGTGRICDGQTSSHKLLTQDIPDDTKGDDYVMSTPILAKQQINKVSKLTDWKLVCCQVPIPISHDTESRLLVYHSQHGARSFRESSIHTIDNTDPSRLRTLSFGQSRRTRSRFRVRVLAAPDVVRDVDRQWRARKLNVL